MSEEWLTTQGAVEIIPKTIDEALAHVREAMRLYIKSLIEDGEPMLITRFPVAVTA